MQNKFNNPQIEKQILEILSECKIPVSIDYVAQHLRISWGTARAILLDMTVEGKLKSQKTTKGLIFELLRKEP